MCALIHLSLFAKFRNNCLQFFGVLPIYDLTDLAFAEFNLHGSGCLLIVEFALTLLLHMVLQSQEHM